MGLGVTLRLALLLGLLTGLFLAAGFLFGGTGGMIIGFALALITNVAAYWFSDSFVLRMYGAKPVAPGTPLHRRLKPVVDRLAKQAGIPSPPLYVVDSTVPNAFATGRSTKHAAVAVTRGLLERLSEKEIEGVLAHEISHVRNRDTLVATMAATLAGALTGLAYAAMFGDEENQSIIGYAFLFILAPVAATLIQSSISRSREYLADQGGARFANPLDLASALEKISASVKEMPARGNTAGSHLFIVNPFSSTIGSLFSTHPPVEERVRKLREMARQMK